MLALISPAHAKRTPGRVLQSASSALTAPSASADHVRNQTRALSTAHPRRYLAASGPTNARDRETGARVHRGIPAVLLVPALALAAHGRLPGVAVVRGARRLTLPAVSCPAEDPVQAVTVVNQANASSWALAKVERAVVAQSLQLRAVWGTPCVQFGPGGWPLYLKVDSGINGDVHYPGPVAFVETEGAPYDGWSEAFSHEVVEMLVDPTTNRDYYDGESTIQVEVGGVISTETELDEHALEVADPVEERGYRLDGVYVTDFALPSYYAGAQWVPVGDCDPSQGVACGPLIAPWDAAGPYDEMGILTSPWQTTWERPD